MHNWYARGATPWVYRPSKNHRDKSRVAVYIPYRDGRRGILKSWLGEKTKIVFDHDLKLWLLSRSHLRKLVSHLSSEFGSCVLYTEHLENERCTGSCKSSKKLPIEQCECCCLGEFHGDGFTDGWRVVVGDYMVNETVRVVAREVKG